MKMASILMMAMCIMLPLSTCEPSDSPNEVEVPNPVPNPENPDTSNDSDNSTDNKTTTQMNITVNGHTLTATLEDNVTAQAFASKLPITLPMMDLYGREMCYRFPEALPTDDAKTRGYEVGEIVYYPPMHSFVIMYKQNGERFQMQSIGRVQGDVSIFDGIGDVSVTFTKADRNSGGKVLVAYFSRANYVPDGMDAVTGATNKAGNTQTVAQYIQEKTSGTLFEIVPERNYPVSHTECSAIAQQEAENNERPALKSHLENMDDYDIVFVGFPIWVYREPMAVLTFLEEYDFTGKTVIPFCTSMAVAISASEEDFKKTLPNTVIKPGLRVNYTLSGNWQGEIDRWIDGLDHHFLLKFTTSEKM